jgi:hypothetical protein
MGKGIRKSRKSYDRLGMATPNFHANVLEPHRKSLFLHSRVQPKLSRNTDISVPASNV